jgi:hypothetical protein
MSPHELHLHWKQKQMTDEQINAAITEITGLWDHLYSSETRRMMDYCTDLNAMHEAEQTLKRMGPEYARNLLDIVSRDAGVGVQYAHGSFAHIKATARQRAEAFLRTLGKWEEVQG